MEFALITTCTNRKKIVPHTHLCAQNLPKGNLDSLLVAWKTRLNENRPKIPAKDLYCGRGFCETLKATEENGIRLWIISAGLGLITKDQKIPAYNLTISPSAKDAIQQKTTPGAAFCTKQWWSRLNKELSGTPHPISDLIKRNQDTLFVLSLSQAYVKFISSDLFSLEMTDLSRVRLVGFNDPSPLPEKFKHLWMPYDERFDGPDSVNPGTRADYPQRVARHFITEILSKNPTSSSHAHSSLVSNWLDSKRLPVREKREIMSDDKIKEIILKRWDEAGGSGTRMLRILRDEEKVACEQGRFAMLFRQIKSRFA